MALDRVLAISAPFWHKNHSSPTNARRVSVTIALFCYVIDLGLLYIFGTTNTDGEKRCEIQEEANEQLSLFYTSVRIYFVAFSAPFVTLLVSNVVFVYSLRRRFSSSQSRPETDQSRAKWKNERNYILMLLILTCSYLILSSTNAILQMVLIGQSEKWNSAQKSFFEVALEVPVILNNSLNFFFYFISGQMFRNAFKKAISKICPCLKQETRNDTSVAAGLSSALEMAKSGKI